MELFELKSKACKSRMKIFWFWFCLRVSIVPLCLRLRATLEGIRTSGMRLGFCLCCLFVSVLLDAQICLADGPPSK